MIVKTVETFWVKIYMSGPLEVAKQVLREECLREGLCVTIDPTIFIYTGGEEQGFVVGLLNYPRFPSSPEILISRAEGIAGLLLKATFQFSALLVTPETTRWISLRESE
jgi:ferredoxin